MQLEASQLKKELGYPYDTTSIHAVKAEEIASGISLEEGSQDFPSFRFDHNEFRFQFASTDGGPFILHFILTQLGPPQKVQLEGVSRNGGIELAGLPKGKYLLNVMPDPRGRKLVLAKEMKWTFEVQGSWDFWKGVIAWAAPFSIIVLGIVIGARREYLKGRISKQDRELFTMQLARLANSAESHTYFNLISSFELIEEARNTLSEKELGNFYTLLRDQGKVFQDSNSFWTLRQEINYTAPFVKLAKLSRDFQYEARIPGEVNNILDTTYLPKALLQSLVENAYKFGVRSRPIGEASILVDIQLQVDRLVIEIIDNGLGILNSNKLNQESTQKGNDLIEGLFEVLNKYPPKNRFSFTFFDRYEKQNLAGVTSRITMPIKFNYPKSE